MSEPRLYVANWKMNMTRAATRAFAGRLGERIGASRRIPELVVAPPIKNPSIPEPSRSSTQFFAVTDPPYRSRTSRRQASSFWSVSRAREASDGVAALPVPIAHTGS